ncbi:mitochondria-eating protein [Caerostris extrusa]|uniref:Mitochondria-eating protein n=1 Tax=Caerostris extrusa TaxID=172846 RepID=A0AAV4XR22_CAEEX|nr:mitochondria-eating protein [Caerostris extrusa]
MIERGTRFENLSLGEIRPTSLIRQYEELYTQARVDTLDALDALTPLKEHDELKTKILFSVVVLSFKSAHNTLSDMKQRIFSVLKIKKGEKMIIPLKILKQQSKNISEKQLIHSIYRRILMKCVHSYMQPYMTIPA